MQVLPPLSDPEFWWLLIVLLIIGLVAIIAIGFLFAFPIAGLAAIAVFFLTGSLLWAGITFLIVALISAAIGDLLEMTPRHHHHEKVHEEVHHEEHHDEHHEEHED
jgi:membrane protein implicated in regulation of membrane protease activity